MTLTPEQKVAFCRVAEKELSDMLRMEILYRYGVLLSGNLVEMKLK